MRRRPAALALALALSVASLATVSASSEAPSYRSSPDRHAVPDKDWGPWLGPFRAALVPSLMQDFGERYLYAPANAVIGPPKPGERRIVFIGDSITDRWDLAKSFPGRPYVNRGIGSQVTAQLVLRFHQDVVALRPAAVVILAGVNDVQGVLQRDTPEQIEANYETMADIADRHGIRVVFGALLPVNDYTTNAHTMLTERPPAELRAINAWLRRFCRDRGYGFADYHAATVDRDGLLARELTDDGLHPLAAGYARMAPVAQAAIDRVLSHKQPPRPKRA